MVIQKILNPSVEVCNEWEMYYRGIGPQKSTEIVIPKGQIMALDTYFNAFSIGKWKKYTRIGNLRLRLKIEGDVLIKGYHMVGNQVIKSNPKDNTKRLYWYGDCYSEETPIEVSCSEGAYQVDFQELYDEGILYVTIEANEDAELSSGAYETDCNMINPVELALGICTFKREEFVQRNVNLVKKNIIENSNSPMHQHLDIYISDNGQTLPEDTFTSNKIHMYPNKNAGGAGGFTRDMIEAFFHRENSPFTHMILMDDDIILDCEVLERTYHFLQLLNPEYKKMMVGGELFELDQRYLQYEAGAAFRGTVIQSYNQKWDMRKSECVSANEIENPMNFNGWWYCCIPREYIREDNLPIPVFIHRDDVEYGVRNQENGTILLNGICVWHPQGPNKAPVAMDYYDARNDLIAMCDSPDRATKKQFKDKITRLTLGYMLRYRYQVIDAVYYGVREFFKGPEFFMSIEPVENHKKVASFNYQLITPEEAGVDLEQIRYDYPEKMKGHVFLRAALSTWLLPSRNYTRVSGTEDIGCAFRARQIYSYDEEKKIGFVTKKSYKEAFRILRSYLSMIRLVNTRFEQTMTEWIEKKPEYISLAFWEKYLELK